MSNEKYADEIRPGDKIEAVGGIFTVVRAHVMGEKVSMIGVVGGVLSGWGTYDKTDKFTLVTVH
jgi:hypothetical protein